MSPKQSKKLILHRNFRPFRDYLVSMIPLAVLSTYIYGWRVPVMLLSAAAVSMLCDLAVAAIRRQPYDVTDLSSVTFAWVFTMLMPASVDLGILIFGVLVTVLLGKHAFGGYGCYPFNPAAFGFAVAAVSFSPDLFLYPQAYETVPLRWSPGVDLLRSPAYSLLERAVPDCATDDLIIGNFPGPIGSTFALVAIACMTLMIVHDAINWQSSVSFMLTCAAWALAFPRVSTGRLQSLLLELICGGIPFAAAYLVCEPTVSPRNLKARFVYGVATGLLTMLITRYGVYEYGVCFALLLTGPLAGALDRYFLSGNGRKEGRKSDG